VARLDRALLYLCTDSRRRQGDLPGFLDAALAGGVDVIQLREKGLEAREEIALLAQFAAAARRHGALFAVNDRADVARAVGPDILHLGQDDLPIGVAREIVGPDVLIGQSTHDVAQMLGAAGDARVDYFCAGPVWPTPTKPGRPAPGLPLLTAAGQAAAGKPWFAIGGIDLARLDQVRRAGAERVVVVRAVTEAADPAGAARELSRRLGR
jgi:thiamine-phosphate pyrophosphorylase